MSPTRVPLDMALLRPHREPMPTSNDDAKTGISRLGLKSHIFLVSDVVTHGHPHIPETQRAVSETRIRTPYPRFLVLKQMPVKPEAQGWHVRGTQWWLEVP